MTVMWNVELDGAGNPIAGKKVYISLLGAPGYGDGFSIESVGEVFTDANGRWEADLPSTDDDIVAPAGTRYSAVLRFRAGTIEHVFSVPESNLEQMVTDYLDDPPGALEYSALSLHVQQTTDAHGGLVAATDPRLTNERVPVDASVTNAKLSAALLALIQSAVDSPPNGPAGGVLSGSYPNPLFAVDMATQAELDVFVAELLSHEGTPHVTKPKFPSYTPLAVGQKYNGNGALGTATRTTGTALNTLIAGGPLFSGDSGATLDLFDANIVTLGAAGAVYRGGVWIIDNQDNPFAWTSGVKVATLLADLGVTPGAGGIGGNCLFDATTAGAKIVTPTVAIVIPPNTWFCLGAVAQGAVSQPTIGATTGKFSPMGQSNVASGVNSTDGFWQMNGVAGALGDLVPYVNLNNIGHGLGFRRSA